MSDNSIQCAKGCLEMIVNLVSLLDDWEEIEQLRDRKSDEEGGEFSDEEEALLKRAEEFETEDAVRDRIGESHFGVQVRSDWHNVGDSGEASEFRMTLAGGGPACQIVGDLNRYMGADGVRLQHQDWFECWTNLETTSEEDGQIERFCNIAAYFGDF